MRGDGVLRRLGFDLVEGASEEARVSFSNYVFLSTSLIEF